MVCFSCKLERHRFPQPDQFRHVLRGPIGIAETSGEVASQGLAEFVWFIAVLSTAIGLMNLFPIPVLDCRP